MQSIAWGEALHDAHSNRDPNSWSIISIKVGLRSSIYVHVLQVIYDYRSHGIYLSITIRLQLLERYQLNVEPANNSRALTSNH